MSFRPRYFRRSTWLRARRSAVLWLCVVTLALQPLESLAAIRQQTQVAIGAPAAMSADPSVQLQKGARTAEYAEKDISFAAVSAVGLTPLPPQLAPLPCPPRQSLTLSGAQPPYPPNHVLDGSVEVVGTPPANHDFETTAIAVGTPPTNHDMAAASYTSGTPPTNHDFEMGTLTGWATSGSVSIQSNATQGYYASLGASGVLTSTAFTVESDAQQLAVAIGYLHAILSSYVEIYVLSGTNYATQTKIGTFFCQNCGWRQETFDLTAYAGQSIQLKFRRTGGTIGIDAPQARVVLPGYATTGVVERASEADDNVYALLSANTAIVSSPFAVANDAQQATLRTSGRSSSIDYYAVYVLSGPDYATATQVVYESVEDSWKTTEFDLTVWRGQSIRLRVARAGGAIGVDDVGVQRVVAPAWEIGGAVVRLEPDGNHYLSANAAVVSDAFVVNGAAQQLTLRYRHGGSAGATFLVKILRGPAFGEEVLAGSHFSTAMNWQTLRVAIGAYLGETIKLKLDVAPLTRFHFDDVGESERVLPGWIVTDPQQGIGVGEDANGSYATPDGMATALSLTSQEVDTGLVDGPGVSARHYAVAYDIGYSTGNALYVYWRNSDGATYKVFQDGSNSPTGYRVRYFPVYDVLGLRGRFILALAGGGKIYSLGDNVARQQLSEPFTYKVGLQIDTASGSFGYQALDVQTGGARPLLFARYYNGHADRLGPLGYGWSHSYETRLVLTEEGNAGVLFGSGKELFFTWNNIGQSFTPADARIHDTLVRTVDGDYLFTTKANQRYVFDAAGVLTAITDANDNATLFGYNAGRLTGVLAPGGLTLTLSYDGAGRLASVSDPLGASVLYTYDAAGDLASVQRPDAGVEQYSYDRHRLRQVVDATGQTLFQNSFDAWHRVVQQTDALSKTLMIQYNTPGAGATTVTDPAGGVTVYYFDRQQRTTDWVAPGGQTTSYLYDAAGNLQKVIDGGAGEWNYAYDGAGNLLSSLDPLGAPAQISYTPMHLPATLTDARGAVTQLSYDTRGNVTQVVDATNKQWGYAYDAAGNLTAFTNPLGQVEQYTYDAAGNRLTRTDALGNTWRWSYDAAGRLATETDPSGHTTTYFYDGAGRISAIGDALGHSQSFTYDAAGHLLRAQDALGGQTVWDYDERGLVEAKIDAAGKRTTYAYDDNRNMVALTDPLSHTTHYAYDGSNRLTEIVRPDGGATHYVYDAAGRVTAESNPLGQTTSYAYDAAGRLVTLTLPNGGVYAFAYDAAGNRTQTTDPLDRVTQVGYDALNRIISVTDPAGMTTQTVYDAAGRKTQTIDAAGQVVEYGYDAAGRLTTLRDPLGRVSAFAYDGAGAQIATADPLGRTSTIGYDALYRPVTLTNAAGHVSTLTYDAGGRLTEMHAPSGGVTHFAYDSRGLQTDVMNALGQSTFYAYDDAGRLVQMTDPAGQVTTYGYDVADRLTSVTDPLGKTTSFGYDAAGNRTSSADALGRIQSISYNALNRPATMTDAAGGVTHLAYDAAGQLTQMQLPSGRVTTYTYDGRGLLTAQTDPLGHALGYEYDAVGRRTRTTAPSGAATTYTYDAAGRVISQTDALGGVAYFTYDAGDRLRQVTDPAGVSVNYEYDLLDNLLSATDALARTHSYSYDAYGRLATATDARGVVVSYGYDLLDRIATMTTPAGLIQFAYDPTGRVSGVVDANGSIGFGYDVAGRITGVTTPQGAVGYAYNDAGQRTGMTLPGGRTVGYGYDTAGRLSTVSDWQGGAATLGYDADGALSNVTRSSGVASTYGYDGAGRLSAVSHSGPTGTLQSYVYTLDANGNRTGVTTQTGSESYAYDALDRLTSVGYTNGDTVSYGYDAAGKRLTETLNGVTTTYDYDAAGQVVSNGVLSYTYDANGNLTGAGSDAYAWDWANRLAGASVGSSSIAYSYDALGVRTGAVVDGVASSFVWDRVTGQVVDDGAQGYVHAPGVLAQLGAAGRGELLADGTGSVRGIADASGVLVGTADFGVFGQNRGQAGVTSSVGSGGAFWTAALRDQSQAPAGLVSAALFGALPTPIGTGGSNSVSTALAHLERLQQVNPTPNRFVGSAGDTESDGASWGGFGGFGGGGAPVGSPALALLLPQTSDPEPANRLPGPYTYASHRPTHGNGGTSALPGANPGLFAAWLLGLEANEDPGGLIGLGQAIVRVFLYVACVLDGECRASLTELQALGEELGSAAQVTMRWTGKLLSRAADLWPLLPNIPKPLAELLSFGVGFVPVVGDLYDLYCGLTGYDPITGERLPEWAQALAIGAAFLPLVSGKDLRIAGEALEWSDEAVAGYRSFTRDNFRENLSRFTDFRPDRSVEAHHVLPQAFAREFGELVSVNIHLPKYGAWVDKKAHRGWSYQYNQKWKLFFERTKAPSLQQVEDFAAQLAEEYGFDVYLRR